MGPKILNKSVPSVIWHEPQLLSLDTWVLLRLSQLASKARKHRRFRGYGRNWSGHTTLPSLRPDLSVDNEREILHVAPAHTEDPSSPEHLI